jgi:hypothetical protein
MSATFCRFGWPSLAFFSLVCFAACGGSSDGVTGSGQQRTLEATVESLGDGAGFEHPELDVPALNRHVKRLTVSMLADSIPIVAGKQSDALDAGDITWTVPEVSDTEALGDDASFALLDKTLGRADYVSVTEEAAEPSALYVKFMDDMARNVCGKMWEADQEREQEKRVLVPFASMENLDDDEGIRANLRYLLLRFLGEKVADDELEYLEPLEELISATAAASSPEQQTEAAWEAVCVGLLSSPAFHLY